MDDLDMLLLQPGAASADGLFAEIVITLPTANAFKTVNGSVFFTISRFSGGQKLDVESVDGSTLYRLAPRGAPGVLYVMHLAECAASLRFQFLAPVDPAQFAEWKRRGLPAGAAETIGRLLEEIQKDIANSFRQAVVAGAFSIPAMPSDLQGVLFWQTFWRPDMTDQELAHQSGFSKSTIANERSRLGMQKRPRRDAERGRMRRRSNQ